MSPIDRSMTSLLLSLLALGAGCSGSQPGRDAGADPCAACPVGQTCLQGDAGRFCGCTSDADCGAQICDATTRTCRACRAASDCEGAPVNGCRADGTCGPCARDADCGPGEHCELGNCWAACDPRDGGDVGCAELYLNADLVHPDAGLVRALFGCQYLGDAHPASACDAAPGSVIIGSRYALNVSCQPSCVTDSDCAAGQRCAAGDCTCASNLDCSAGRVCERAGRCGPCDSNDECPCGQVCGLDRACHAPCATDADCSGSDGASGAALVRCSNGSCVPCGSDADCSDAGARCYDDGCHLACAPTDASCSPSGRVAICAFHAPGPLDGGPVSTSCP